MINKQKGGVLITVLVLMFLAFLAYVFFIKNNTSPVEDNSQDVEVSEDNEMNMEDETEDNPPILTTTINVPLISNDSGDFGPFGCGAYITFVPQQVPQTQAVLNATYEWLFTNPADINIGGSSYVNTIASVGSGPVEFDSVDIVNGVAKIYLTGSIYANHCGDPAFGAQIEQAALQYSTVNNIEVYLNGTLFDWCALSQADPSESGCDTTPKPWNTQRFFEI